MSTSSVFTNPEATGYVGFGNLPNQVHRKYIKKGFGFTLMVVGESGLGKSTLIKSMFMADMYSDRTLYSDRVERTVKIQTNSIEIEEQGVKLRLTVVDTPGFGDAINNNSSYGAIVEYIDAQFQRYFQDESGVNRKNITDTRIHCCFYFINPASHGLKPLDVEFMKAVHNKVNIVPVIAKADTLTKQEQLILKEKIRRELVAHKIKTYDIPEDPDDDDDAAYRESVRQLKAAIPFAVIGSTAVMEVRGKRVRARQYPWGIIEVENPEHCDFVKLRAMLVTHMHDMQEITHEVHYESFRADQLMQRSQRAAAAAGGAGDFTPRKLDAKEEELARLRRQVEEMQRAMKQTSGSSIISNGSSAFTSNS